MSAVRACQGRGLSSPEWPALQGVQVDLLLLSRRPPPSGSEGVRQLCDGEHTAFALLLISFSAIPRSKLRSSLFVASAWHRWRNSHTWQWELSISLGSGVVLASRISTATVGLRYDARQLDPSLLAAAAVE